MKVVARLLACVLAASLFPAVLHARPATPPATVQSRDVQRRLDEGGVTVMQTNFGTIGRDLISYRLGMLYPRGTTNGVMYAAGLWLGGKVAGERRIALAEYASEFAPGAIVGGLPDSPWRPEYVVWKVHAPFTAADTAHVMRTPEELAADPTLDPLAHHGWGEYLANAVPFGAPIRVWRLPNTATPDPSDSVDVPGPVVEGALSTWCVFNDADPSAHEVVNGLPVGVEVRQTSWTLADAWSDLRNVVFVRWRIVNRNATPIDSLVIGLWADPDLGGPSDDLVGWDGTRQMGYIYNGRATDEQYGVSPPALGALFLTSPGVGQPTAQSFVFYVNGTDPSNATHAWSMLNGYTRDGQARTDPTTGQPTMFDFPGDPVTSTGWVDANPADRRFLMTQPGGLLAAGDSVDVTAAFVVASGSNRLESVNQLRCTASYLRDMWAARFPQPVPPRPSCPVVADCPRTSAWWAGECSGGEYAAPTLYSLVYQVSGLPYSLRWPDPFPAFCATMAPGGGAREAAYREYTALLGNVLAGRLGLQPQSGNPVRLTGAVNASCPPLSATTLDEVIQVASWTTPVVLGRYLDDSPTHVGAGLDGTGWSMLPSMSGGVGSAFDFFVGLDPAAYPDSFTTVRITFDRTRPKNAYRYLRLETEFGGAPSVGRGYLYAGYHPTFLTAVDTQTGDTLSLGFVERTMTDANGTILPPASQLATFDSTWTPDASDLGGREYLFVSKRPWSATPRADFAVDGAVTDNDALWVYAMWLRLTSANPGVLDDGDGLELSFGIPIEGGGVDQALVGLASRSASDPAVQLAYAQIAQCLAAINRGDRSMTVCDAPTAVLASLVSAVAQPDRVQLEWMVSASGMVSVERRPVDGSWARVAQVSPDGVGHVAWQDTDVTPGSAYDYRVRIGDATAGDVRVSVPGAFRLALTGLRPNPATSASSVVFSLASREPATLEMLDVAGRRVWSRTLRTPQPGAQVLALGDAHLAPGIYLVRLSQGAAKASAKAVIL